jgi:DNA-directed RNA polymerase specialized sigma24 family protein
VTIDKEKFSAAVKRCQVEEPRASDLDALCRDFFFPLCRGVVGAAMQKRPLPPGLDFDELVSDAVVTCWVKLPNCRNTATAFGYFTAIAFRAIARSVRTHHRHSRGVGHGSQYDA